MHFLTLNRIKFGFRTLVLLIALCLAIIDYALLVEIFHAEIGFIRVYHLLWMILMIGMIQVCIPVLNNYVSCGKLFAKHFKQTDISVKETVLKQAVAKNNRGAIRSALFWTLIMTIVGGLYLNGLIDRVGLVLVSVFFYFSDQFCINVWCPFRAWLVGNKCCNACRIYNWGHFMIVSPLIFIPSFWSYSLVFVSLLLLFQWEWQHYRYPERFVEEINDNLKCQHCMKAKCGYIKV